MSVIAHIMDPEIVFVANLTKADAPALAASFQCSFMLSGGSEAQQMTARVLDLRVLACPFLRGTAKKNVTTVSPLLGSSPLQGASFLPIGSGH